MGSPLRGLRATAGAHLAPEDAGADRLRPICARAALTASFHDTLDTLIRPFNARQWIKLSILCLFLGGGTPSAAFNWSWGALPHDIRFRIALDHARRYVNTHLWLALLVAAFALGLALSVLYLRSVLRFVLVDAILKRSAFLFGPAFAESQPLGRSYFFWFLGSLGAGTALVVMGAVAGIRYLRAAVAAGTRSLEVSVALAVVFLMVMLGGLAVAVLVTLTDDLVVPIMYGERLPLLLAWRKLARGLRAEPAAFATYVLLRFGISLLIGVVLLLLLFPLLLSLFSSFLIVGALIVLGLRLAGFAWVWSPFTILLAAGGLLVLTGILLVVLGVIGMPGQVLLQDYGMRFIASRFPSTRLTWRIPAMIQKLNLDGESGSS